MRYTCHLHASHWTWPVEALSRPTRGFTAPCRSWKSVESANIKGTSQREMFHATSMFQSASLDAMIHRWRFLFAFSFSRGQARKRYIHQVRQNHFTPRCRLQTWKPRHVKIIYLEQLTFIFSRILRQLCKENFIHIYIYIYQRTFFC